MVGWSWFDHVVAHTSLGLVLLSISLNHSRLAEEIDGECFLHLLNCCICFALQECPKCHVTIEKNGGCNHMLCRNQTCKVCVQISIYHRYLDAEEDIVGNILLNSFWLCLQAEFCWVCLGPWDPHGSSWWVLHTLLVCCSRCVWLCIWLLVALHHSLQSQCEDWIFASQQSPSPFMMYHKWRFMWLVWVFPCWSIAVPICNVWCTFAIWLILFLLPYGCGAGDLVCLHLFS